jgi:hypothetical protein
MLGVKEVNGARSKFQTESLSQKLTHTLSLTLRKPEGLSQRVRAPRRPARAARILRDARFVGSSG